MKRRPNSEFEFYIMTGFQWEKYEAWRKHPLLNPRFIDYLPGIKIGVGAFALFVVYDKLLKPKKPEHH
eukprot:g6856.t1